MEALSRRISPTALSRSDSSASISGLPVDLGFPPVSGSGRGWAWWADGGASCTSYPRSGKIILPAW